MMDAYERSILKRYKRQYKTTQRISEALHCSQPTISRKLKKYGL